MKRLRESTGLLCWLARLGYGSRGLVYLIVGGLALLDAVGTVGQESVDSKGALEKIIAQPFGQTLLSIVAVGLLGYSLWRLIQAVADPDDHGTGPKGVAVRGGLLVSCITHVGLAVFAASLIFGWGAGGGDGGNSAQDWTAWLLDKAFGRWLVGGLGLLVIGAGIAHFYKGATAGFEKYFIMDRGLMRWATPVCQFGLMARGVVFGIIGGFFIVAAVHFNSGQARGLKGALDTLEAQPFGPWMLGMVGTGLVAFGIYSLIEAGYRRIDPPEPDL